MWRSVPSEGVESGQLDDFCDFRVAAEILGLSEWRVALLIGRRVLTPSRRYDGTRGVSRASVEAEARRRADRGLMRKAWDAFKAILRWMP